MKRILLFLSLSILIHANSIAQAFPYTLTTFEDTYTPLSEALLLTPTNDENWDDPAAGYYSISIGFNFDLMGRSSDMVALIDPGCQLVLGIDADTVNAISPYFADIRNADTLDVVSAIVYSTEGMPGNRIFKIEWQNVGFFDEFDATGEFNSTSNYQVWFYETSNDIEFRYGPNTISDGTLIHMQWPAPLLFFIKDFIIQSQVSTYTWSLMGPAADPTVGPIDLYVNPAFEDLLIGEPSEGTVYHFGAIASGINENEILPSFSVFPTMATDHVMTYWNGFNQTALRVYDISGTLLLNTTMNHGNRIFDIATWPSGMYFFTTGEGPAMQTQRVVKQ